jgi:hypothetical protein
MRHIVTLLVVIVHFEGVWAFGVQRIDGTASQGSISTINRQCRGYYAFSTDKYDNEDTEDLSDEELEASVGKWDEKIARFNTIQLTGRVGNTPEARYFDDGKVVVNLSLASRRKYHGMERKLNNIKMGEEETDWYGLEIWVRYHFATLKTIS